MLDKPNYIELYSREKKVLHIIAGVEARGLRWDIKKAQYYIKLLNAKAKICLAKMTAIAGEHNPASLKQVLTILLSLGLTRKQLTEKGALTTGSNTLKQARKELPEKHKAKTYIEALLDYRSYTKTVGTYLVPLTEKAMRQKGIVYCQINPADTITGRMASREPNLQNMPKNIKNDRANPVRSCFICRDGYTNYYFDYSQMEMAIFGVYANEQRILTAYETGEDLHLYTAAEVYRCRTTQVTDQMRSSCKAVNFGIIYGEGIKALAKGMNRSISDAMAFMKNYHNTFPSIERFQWECKEQLQTYGYVEDWFGKRYHVPVGQAYKAVNCLVQGTCAQIFKQALINVNAQSQSNIYDIFDDTNIILPVHDEIQIEARLKPCHEEEFVRRTCICMTDIEQVTSRGLTLKVDACKSTTNWAEKEKIKL